MEQANTPEMACADCGRPLRLSTSNRNRDQLVGCTYCRQRQWYDRNKERVKAESKTYYQRTSQRRREVAKARRDAMSPLERNKNNRQIALKRKYGLTLAQYEQMVAEQNGLCFLCEQQPSGTKRLCVDHCHKEKRVRKLLCQTCNFFLGVIERDPGWVDRALQYLKS